MITLRTENDNKSIVIFYTWETNETKLVDKYNLLGKENYDVKLLLEELEFFSPGSWDLLSLVHLV